MNFEVEYFQKDDGTYPVEDFILSQEYKMQAKIFRFVKKTEKTPKREIDLAKSRRKIYTTKAGE
mgnify:CR=1 FL=1